jgi:ferredoxin
MPGFIVFAAILVTSIVFFVRSCSHLVKILALGRKEDRLDHPGKRIKNVLLIAFAQTKVMRERFAGLLHVFIFWGFVVLLTAILEAIIEGFAPSFTLSALGPFFPPLAALQEVIGLLVFIACLLALARWHFSPPKRYFGREITEHVRQDATLILTGILVIILSMFGTNAARMAVSGQISEARFLSIRLVPLFTNEGGTFWYELFWWTHILVVLGFLNYLPHSKHLHVLTSIPNVFCSSLEPRGRLSKLNLEDEDAEKFGADDIRDLTWKQLLDGFTCTDCGRCTVVCPANVTGKILSPRKIMMNIRGRSVEMDRFLSMGACRLARIYLRIASSVIL